MGVLAAVRDELEDAGRGAVGQPHVHDVGGQHPLRHQPARPDEGVVGAAHPHSQALRRRRQDATAHRLVHDLREEPPRGRDLAAQDDLHDGPGGMLPCDVSGFLHLHAEGCAPGPGARLLVTQEAVPERFVGGIRLGQGAGKHRHHPGRIRERHHGGRTGGTACEPPWKPVPSPAQGGRGGATREGFQVDWPVEGGHLVHPGEKTVQGQGGHRATPRTAWE